MKEIFKFIFILRYVKKERVKITISNIFLINSFYRSFNMKRWMTFKEYFAKVVDNAIDHGIDFKTSSKKTSFEILDEKLIMA